MEQKIKTTLAILLFICLLDMPYGFYQLVRFIALIGFGYLAFHAKQRNHLNEAFVYASLALLFQPLLKITLGRTLWEIVDVVVGIGLITSVLKERIKS